MNYQNFVPITGVISDIIPMTGSCCSQLISIRTGREINNFVLSANTFVADNTRLRTGMRVSAYYDSSHPVPLIFPPQYQAEIITAIRPDESAILDFFNRNLVNSSNTLQLNIAPATSITTDNGQRFHCRLGNQFLLVYYSATTRSIPAQTTPRRIIVLCE